MDYLSFLRDLHLYYCVLMHSLTKMWLRWTRFLVLFWRLLFWSTLQTSTTSLISQSTNAPDTNHIHRNQLSSKYMHIYMLLYFMVEVTQVWCFICFSLLSPYKIYIEPLCLTKHHNLVISACKWKSHYPVHVYVHTSCLNRCTEAGV